MKNVTSSLRFLQRSTWKRFVFPSLMLLVVLGLALTRMQPAEAAACTSTVATVTQTSSPIFYVDDPSYDYGYISYQVTAGSSTSFSDMWVKVDSFSNATNLTLASTDSGVYHVGALSANSSANVYFFLKAAPTSSAQTYTLHIYSGKPGSGGSESCSSSQSNSSVSTTIQSSNNTVSSVTYTAPYVGSTFTMTVIGTTGTIGSAGIFSYTPASQTTWNAGCLQLSGTSLTMTGGNTGTFTGGLYRSGLSSTTTNYTIVYTFRAECVTSSSTPVVPLTYISSGAQIKHTSVSNYGTLPPIAPATNSLYMTKTVSPAASASGGTATYKLNITNGGPSSAVIDDFVDTLPSSPVSVTYSNNTATYNSDNSNSGGAASISNPSISGQTLTWVGVFTIPSGKTATLSFQATIPSTTGDYVNSAIANVGSAQIDQTTDTTDNSPATATYGVGDPSMAASTKTVVDLNGTTVEPGDTLKYTITAADTGSNDATNVHVTDTIDTNTNSLTSIVVGDNHTNCGTSYTNSSTSTQLNITGLTVTHGSTCVITYEVTVSTSATAGTTILNSASIVPGNAGGISGSPSSTPLVVHRDPNLSITNTTNDNTNTATANQTITYTSTITNTGFVTADGVNFTSTFTGPVGSLSSRTLTNCGPSTTYVDTSSMPTVTIAALSITTTNPCVISYSVTVNAGTSSGSITNVDSATAAIEGGNAPSNASAPTILIGATPTAPNLSATVSDSAPSSTVVPGQTVTYTISTQNTGQTNATTSLSSTIPTGMGTPSSIQYFNCGAPGSSYSAPTLSVSSLTINAGSTCTITFNEVITSPLNNGTTLTLTATPAQASQSGSNTPSTASDRTLTVQATPSLSITSAQNSTSNTVSRSQDVTYTITLANTGNGQGTGIGLTDAFTGPVGNPGSFSFSNCGSSYTNSSSTSVNITGLTVQVGTNCVVTFHEIVNSNATNGSTITDSAVATAASEGGNTPLPASAPTMTVSVTAVPNLVVGVSNNSTSNTVTPGQTVTYTVTIQNTGTANGSTNFTASIPSNMGTPGNFTYSSCGSPSSGFSAPTLTISSITVASSATCTVTFTSTVSSPLSNGTTLSVVTTVAQASQGGNTPSPATNTVTVSSAPALGVTSSQNIGSTVNPGQSVTYTVTTTNTGTANASGISLSDPISGSVGSVNTVGFSGCGSSHTDSSSGSTLSVGSLVAAVGTPCVVTFHVTVNSNATGGSTVSDSADATAAAEGGNNPGAVSATTLTVATVPNLSASLTDNASSTTVNPGQTIQFSLTIGNTGNGTGHTSATVSVPSAVGSPSSVVFANCGSASSSYSSSTLTLSSLAITTSNNCVVTFNETVNSPGAQGATFSLSSAVAQATEGGNTPSSASSRTFTINVVPGISMSATQNSVGNAVTTGQNLTYTVTLSNNGSGTGTGIGLTDTFTGAVGSPGSFTFTNCGSSYTNNSTTNVSITGLAVSLGTNCVVTYHLTVNSNAAGGSTITDSADATAAAEGGNDPSPVSAPTVTVTTVPNLSVNMSDNASSTTVSPTEVVQFTATLANSGNGTGHTSATVSIPAAVGTPSSVVFTNCGSATSSYSSGTLTLSSLAVGITNNCVVTFSETVSSPGTQGATFSLTTTASQANEGGNTPGSATSRTFTVSLNTANLSTSSFSLVDHSGSSTPAPGDTMDYTLTVINTGNTTATGVNVTSTMNTNVTLTTASVSFSNCGSSHTNTSTSSTLTLGSLQIAVGTNCVITFSGTLHTPLNSGTAISGTANVSAASQGGAGATPSTGTLYVSATLALSVTSMQNTSGNSAAPGQNITYTTTISNSGNGDASGVSLIDSISGPVGSVGTFSFSNCGSLHSNSSSGTVVSLSSLVVTTAASCVVTYHVTVNSNAAAASTISNSADVGAATEGGNDPAPVSAATVTVSTAPNLSATVTDNTTGGNVVPGQAIQFTVTVTNSGNGTGTTSATATIPITYVGSPTSIQFTNCGPASSSYSAPTLTLSSLSITTVHTCVITFTVSVNSPATNNTTFAVSSTVAQATQGGNTPSTATSETLTIHTTPDLSTSTFSATDLNGSPAHSGDTLGYTLTIKNTGSQQGTGVSVADTVDTNTSLNTSSITFTNCGSSHTNTSTATALNLSGLQVAIGTNCVIYFETAVHSSLSSGTQLEGSTTVSPATEGGLGATLTANTLTIGSTPTPPSDPSGGGETTGSTTGTTTGVSSGGTLTLLQNSAASPVTTDTGQAVQTVTPQNISTSGTTGDSGDGTTTVTILVLDSAGVPIRNARVVLHSTPRTAYTNNLGIVTFYGVPIGQHTAYVYYGSQAASAPVALKSGTVRLHVTLTLKHVQVHDDDWCWLWWLLLLVIIYLLWRYYRYRRRKDEERKRKHT
jgi:fimbrial isopeptide formation D2 family protein/uncharacterized repeat protein (TIGR01451 family)